MDSASVRLDTLVADMEGIRLALRLERIPDAKRFSFSERPEAFLGVVRALLREAGGASASR